MQQARQRPRRVRTLEQAQRRARRHLAGFEHAVVPAGAGAVLHPPRHVRRGEAQVELPAGLARLGDLDEGAAQAKDVADADVRLGQAGGAEVLAEGTDPEQVRRQGRQVAPPRGVVLAGVMVHRLFRAAVMPPVALFVALESLGAQFQRPVDCVLVDRARFAVGPERSRPPDQEPDGRGREKGRALSSCCRRR